MAFSCIYHCDTCGKEIRTNSEDKRRYYNRIGSTGFWACDDACRTRMRDLLKKVDR